MNQTAQSKSDVHTDKKLERLANLLGEMLAIAWLRRKRAYLEADIPKVAVQSSNVQKEQG